MGKAERWWCFAREGGGELLYCCCLMDGLEFFDGEGIFESQGTYSTEQKYFFVNIPSGGGEWSVDCTMLGARIRLG